MTINKLLEQTISLQRLELHLIDLPQIITFKSGIGTRNSREALIVKWIDANGNLGYGECACRPDPYYSVEYRDATADVIQKFIAPFLKKEQSYAEILAILKRVRGWNFTKAQTQEIKQLTEDKMYDNVFVFTHHVCWYDMNKTPQIKPNSSYGRDTNQTFYNQVLPKL